MRKTLSAALLLCLAQIAPAMAQGAAPPPIPPMNLFTAGADIPAVIAKAKAAQKSPEVNSTVPVAVDGPYRVLLEYRTGLTPPTVHHGQTELVYVLQGNATLVSGGHLTGVQPPRPGSTTDMGTGIEGADKSQALTKGDILLVPADTAHQFQDVKGEFVILSVHMFMPQSK
jgi:mannose-6-phosphate isomerase-like protein (cupin superfamily)